MLIQGRQVGDTKRKDKEQKKGCLSKTYGTETGVNAETGKGRNSRWTGIGKLRKGILAGTGQTSNADGRKDGRSWISKKVEGGRLRGEIMGHK